MLSNWSSESPFVLAVSFIARCTFTGDVRGRDRPSSTYPKESAQTRSLQAGSMSIVIIIIVVALIVGVFYYLGGEEDPQNTIFS